MTEETLKILERAREKEIKIGKAVTNIGKCLDGYSVEEAEKILNRVRADFLERAVIRASDDRETDTTR